jgi:hypothetical protein
MYATAMRQATLIRDDQQIFVKYAHTHPEAASLDLRRIFFLTNYKEVRGLSVDLTRHLAVLTSRGKEVVANGVGLLHCNNIKSSTLYDG